MNQDWRIIGWSCPGSEVTALGRMSKRSQGWVGVRRLCAERVVGVMIHRTARAVIKGWSETSLRFKRKDGIDMSRESRKMVQTGMLNFDASLYALILQD